MFVCDVCCGGGDEKRTTTSASLMFVEREDVRDDDVDYDDDDDNGESVDWIDLYVPTIVNAIKCHTIKCGHTTATECRRCGRRRPSFDGAPQFARNGLFSPWLSIEFEFRTIFGVVWRVVYRKTLNPLSAGVSRNCLSGGTCVRAYSQSLTLLLASRVQRVCVCVLVCPCLCRCRCDCSERIANSRVASRFL